MGGAFEVGAAPCNETVFLGDGCMAGRAFSGYEIIDREGGFRGIGIYDLDDSRNDFPGFLNEDFGADVNAFLCDLVLVVKGGTGNGGAGDENGGQLCDRC